MIPSREDLPPEMTNLPDHWGGWNRALRNGKEIKLPIELRAGKPNRTNDKSGWIGFDEARDLVIGNSYAGLAFLFTKELGIVGGDLDDCLRTDGGLKQWARRILANFRNTYHEISPSGTGVHFFARGKLSGNGLKVYVDADGCPVKEGSAEVDGAVELYDFGRYFAITGRAIGPREITGEQSAIDVLYSQLRGRREKPSADTKESSDGKVAEGGRHAMLLGTGGQWRNAGMDREGILQGLRAINRQKCDPPKTEHELQGIVNWLMTKPAKYRLVPKDFEKSRQTVNGAPTPAPEPDPEDDGVAEKVSAIDRAESLLAEVIEAKQPSGIYDAALIEALAAAGDIKQFEAKRRLKAAFGRDFAAKEWDTRISRAVGELRKNAAAFSDYILSSNGSMKPCVSNAIKMMDDLPLQYNAFTERPFLTGEVEWERDDNGNWTDNDDTRGAEWCQKQGLIIDKGIVADAAITIAKARRPYYHPVLEYLHSLTWDGVPRLDTWLTDYMGSVNTPYTRNVGVKWMISAVQRVTKPGCQADYTIVFEGGQGKRKSTALRTLAVRDEWFTDDITGIGEKDSAMQLQGKWIVELPELDAVKRAREVTTVKAWLVRRQDHFRPPYGRRAEDFPRHCVFAATTNKDEWANDDTGLRRFWPVRVGKKIDIAGLERYRAHLWAEAVFREAEGELSYLPEEVEALAAAEQHERQDMDAWKDIVEAWIALPTMRSTYGSRLLSTTGRIYLPDILTHCLGLIEKEWTVVAKFRVTRILTLAGYTKVKEECEEDGRILEYWVVKS